MTKTSKAGQKPKPDTTPIPCQLYLSVCASPDAANAERVAAVLSKIAVPSLLIEPRKDEKLTATNCLPIIEAAQMHGVAVMIADDACLARTIKADGIHLNSTADGLDRFSEAREISGGRLMIGADAGFSRHNAMVLAEAGAEYVAFGIPSGTGDVTEAFTKRHEMVEWWAEVFEVPCVATGLNGGDTEASLDLAAAGADFVCVRMPDGKPTADLIDWAKHLIDRLDSEQAEAA